MIELSVVDSGNYLTQLVPLSWCLASFLQVEIVKNDSVKFILPIAVACLLAKLRVAACAKEEATAKGACVHLYLLFIFASQYPGIAALSQGYDARTVSLWQLYPNRVRFYFQCKISLLQVLVRCICC